MTGSASDPLEWQPHIRNKPRREALAERFKDPADPFRIVIVRDMWLTGFDAPCLHTMYVDKPMRGHGLMQAIARVNRVFKDKPGGLVVDYLGLADELESAGDVHGDGRPRPRGALAGRSGRRHAARSTRSAAGSSTASIVGRVLARLRRGAGVRAAAAQEHILAQEDGKQRLLDAVYALSRAFALAVPSDEAMAIRDDVAFFQAVRAVLRKSAAGERQPTEDLDHAIRQIVSRAVASDEIVDIFAAAG